MGVLSLGGRVIYRHSRYHLPINPLFIAINQAAGPGVAEVVLRARDLETMEAFYGEVLGLELRKRLASQPHLESAESSQPREAGR